MKNYLPTVFPFDFGEVVSLNLYIQKTWDSTRWLNNHRMPMSNDRCPLNEKLLYVHGSPISLCFHSGLPQELVKAELYSQKMSMLWWAKAIISKNNAIEVHHLSRNDITANKLTNKWNERTESLFKRKWIRNWDSTNNVLPCSEIFLFFLLPQFRGSQLLGRTAPNDVDLVCVYVKSGLI